jgi:5-formyltetrahydrofolate cyclo-ligase
VTLATQSDSVPSGAALRLAKLALRTERLAARDALAAAARHDASIRIAASVASLPTFADANVVLLTWPFRSEWDTRPLLAAAYAAGKTVVLPRVDRTTRMLCLHAVVDPDRDVEVGFQGIPEPRPDAPAVGPDAIDWVLVPGIAFDRTGARLGYGGGFYDRLLPLLRPGIPRIAGAFELQLTEHVPIAPHDLRVDAVVTETRRIDCREDRR